MISLKSEFSEFWKKANDKAFDEQLAIWNETVEKPHQDVYDSLVYSKKYSKDWEKKKSQRIQKFFSDLNKIYPEIQKNLDTFPETVSAQLAKYSKTFPDAKFKNKIYALPFASFNGKAGDLDSTKETVLAFGMNVMKEVADDPDVLYSHELFHIYHNTHLNIDENVFREKAKLTLPLWMEGLATYVSKEMNPSKGDNKVFMSEDLPKVSTKDIQWLAEEFLKDADKKSFDPQNPEIYQKWFTYGHQVRKDIPTRAGYLLGYHVVKNLAKNHSTAEMAKWDINTFHINVKLGLGEIANGKNL